MLKEKKLIYLASPYTHKDKRVMKLRFDQVTAIAAHLVREGYVVFSPITYGHTLCEFEDLPVEFEFWNDFCLKFLEKSDLFVRLEFDGWEESKGLKEEVKFCKENKIPQYFIPPRNGEFQLDRISKSIESALSLIKLKDFAVDWAETELEETIRDWSDAAIEEYTQILNKRKWDKFCRESVMGCFIAPGLWTKGSL